MPPFEKLKPKPTESAYQSFVDDIQSLLEKHQSEIDVFETLLENVFRPDKFSIDEMVSDEDRFELLIQIAQSHASLSDEDIPTMTHSIHPELENNIELLVLTAQKASQKSLEVNYFLQDLARVTYEANKTITHTQNTSPEEEDENDDYFVIQLLEAQDHPVIDALIGKRTSAEIA